MELFNTNQYTTGTAYDFEIQQDSQRKGKKTKQPIYDPAWEDGSAFPGMKDEAEGWKEGDGEAPLLPGDRLINPGGTGGVIQKASSNKCKILWDNGHAADYTLGAIQRYGYQKVKESDSPGETLHERTASSDDLSSDDLSDGRWNPDHFNSNPAFKAEGEQLTIFLETGEEPPEPEDFKSITEYEEAWEQWENLSNWTCVAASASGSPLLESKPEGLSSSDLPRLMVTAQTISSAKDSQESPTLETCMSSPPSADDVSNRTLSQLPHLAPRLVSKENDSEPTTRETASPQSSASLSDVSQDSLQLKTSEDSSIAPLDQVTNNPTLAFSSGSFPAAGMMSNGVLYQVERLERPTLEKGCFWLESPTALSSTGRAPGTTKLESSLIRHGAMSRGQVANPIFLEESFGIPQGWTDPLECRAATELSEEDAKRSEMLLIQESPRSLSPESNTYTQLPPSEPELIPENFSEETKKDRRRGCLYRYLENKKLKNGTIASYPRVTGERDPENPKHWRWGFNWEEKKDGQWKNRSFGCVPVGAIPMIQQMQKSDVPLQEIIDFVRRSKRKVRD